MREMKDSGIEWLGIIPKNWKVFKVKNIAKRKSDKNRPDEQVLSLYRELGIVIKSERDDNHNVTSENTDNYRYVEENDIVVNKMKAWQGSIAVSAYTGIVSPAYYVYKLTDESVYPWFVHYMLRCKAYLPEYRRLSGGIRLGQWDLSDENFKNIPLPVPATIEEQKQIVDYLDVKCSKIDEIIEKQQAIIEKLKEYKLSIITEAVTKGLNPDAEMKDSGNIEIGKIPSISRPTKLKHLCNTQGRIGFKGYTTTDLVDEGEGAYTLGASHLNNGKIDLTDPVFISWEKYYESPEIMVKQNDILIVQRGSTIGKVAIVDKNYGEVTINPSLVLINKIHIDSKYLLYALSARYIANYINLIGTTTAIPMISQKQINDLVVIVPPDSIQISVVKYLDEKCSKIDTNILKKQKLIEKLQEYKKSLIYEVVTGKKEV